MRRTLECLGVLVLGALAVVCWNAGVTDSLYAAVPDGAPEFVSTRYSGSWIAVALVSLIACVLLAVDVVRLTADRSRSRVDSPTP